MAWIQVDDGIREHDKIYNLADALGITNAHAVGLMVCFWTWAATAAPDGDITNFPPRAISRAAGWDKGGSKGALKFYNELIRINFLEKHEDGTIHIRNWEQRATLLLDYIEKQRENTRRRVQKCRERKKKKQSVTVTPQQDAPVTPCNGDCNVTETLCNGTTLPNLKVPNHNKLSVINTPSSSTVEGVTSDVTSDGGADENFETVCQAFEEKVNPMPSAKDGSILQELFQTYPVSRILKAIEETKRCKGRSASYVRSVLQNDDREKKERPPTQEPDLADPNRYKAFAR
jgi:hypothetical protein